jgi:hypothetical protein
MRLAGLLSSAWFALAAGEFSGSFQLTEKNFASATETKNALVFFLAPW